MVTDGWTKARSAFAQLLGRNQKDAQNVAAELEAARRLVAAARQRGDSAAEADVTAQWSARLLEALRQDPACASLLAQTIEVYAANPARQHADAQIHDNTFNGPVAVHTGSGNQTVTFSHPAS
jgi:hypothetical protein